MRPIPAALALCAAILLAGCRPAADTAPEAGDVAVARVEGETLWASDVRREAVAQGLIGEGEALAPTSDLFRRVLDEVIDHRLLAAEAERRGLDNSGAAQRRLEATRQRILGDMLVEAEVNDTINEKAVETIYAEQVKLAQAQDEIRSRLILSARQEEAEAVAALARQGAAFEVLAQQRSTDEATRFSGGDLGYATLDVLPRAYADALREAAAGSIVGPFQTEGGWAVLKVEDRRRETPPTLEQARPQIVRYLTYEGVRQLLERLRGDARIDVLLPPDRPAGRAAPTGEGETP